MNAMRMVKFSVYETSGRYYIFGSDVEDAHYRVLKIDRTAAPGQLSVTEDDIVYSRKQADALLQTIEDGNKNAGGLKLKTVSWGLLGFIRFTDAYYMLLITKKQQVAMIGGRYIYQVDGTELVPLTTGSSSRFASNRNAEETRYLAILHTLDLHRSFYFSYSYNVTRTLQHNIIKHRSTLEQSTTTDKIPDYHDMFIWNRHLLEPAREALRNPFDWCVPIIHGFVDQASVNVFGRNLYITILARRSRFFAGARFLKRGANDLGYVANDVETEQIVADMAVTSFNTSKFHPLNNPNYTSFVQHRGSIPLYWTQDNTGVSPKPAIDINLIDPFYSTAALHFDNLFQRYRAPVCVLNLVKARERNPRESKLLVEYQNAINYLNQMLPADNKIIYRAYDMSRALKTRGQDVIATLEEMAEELVMTTGFFHNGVTEDGGSAVQNGIIRSNCIDCLDRTNAAQFVVGKKALAYQLQSLGVIADASLNYDSDASNLFAHMFNDHGDTLASQYGGSHLVNTTDSYRKITNWQSHSRDMLESFKRYYHNSFLDSQRQEAYNLFLGNYIYAQGQPMLWELPNDFYLHHTMPGSDPLRRRHYVKWFTPEYLKPQQLTPIQYPDRQLALFEIRDWWDEYYRPLVLSSFLRVFSYRMNSTTRYLPKHPPYRYDMSPFAVRKTSSHETAPLAPAPSSKSAKGENASKSESVADSQSRSITPLHVTSAPHAASKRIASLQTWLLTSAVDGREQTAAKEESRTVDKTMQHQWTLGQFMYNSLHPTISAAESTEYSRYLSHAERLGQQPESQPISFSSRHRLQAQGENKHADFTQYLSTMTVPSLDSLRAVNKSMSIDVVSKTASKAISRVASRDMMRDSLNKLPSSTLQAVHTNGNIGRGDVSEEKQGQEFKAWLRVPDDPIAVTAVDSSSKRYVAYSKWLRGKSLFKQSKVDPEFPGG